MRVFQRLNMFMMSTGRRVRIWVAKVVSEVTNFDIQFLRRMIDDELERIFNNFHVTLILGHTSDVIVKP